MNKQNIGTFLLGFGSGVLFTTTLTSIYCVYFRKNRKISKTIELARTNAVKDVTTNTTDKVVVLDKSSDCKCNPCVCDPCKC
jgi:hypothetical protein